ncbi:MAG: sodium:proton antiporter NhaD [Pseudomonadota bacterium]|nr:sodium:proton antiporter NhaD [Pseudomonadota bacterium]
MNFYNKLTTNLSYILLSLFLLPNLAFSAENSGPSSLDMITSPVGIFCLLIFVLAYAFVMAEEYTHYRKSKPVIIAATIIWVVIGYVASNDPNLSSSQWAQQQFRHVVIEFAELFFFLFVAMAYVNSLTERRMFDALCAWLSNNNFSYRKIFVISGIIAFFLSPIADNLTTALILGTVVMVAGRGNKKFIVPGLINIVVAANAGGAFSPFGDITTLMVWQRGFVSFFDFFNIFVPSVVNYVVPAAIMYFAIPNEIPKGDGKKVTILPGGKVIAFLGILTITLTVTGHNVLHMPPILGMMFGLGMLGTYGYFLKTKHPEKNKFDIFVITGRAEWDTLLFFYGILFAVGGLASLGYLKLISDDMYVTLGATYANILVGILSAIIDNIPIVYAVLTAHPAMDMGQWLLITLTAGVGGSLLSIGSAAGVALMGQARGVYTFFAHLKWAWAILLGYAASIVVHLWMNKHLFDLIPLER